MSDRPARLAQIYDSATGGSIFRVRGWPEDPLPAGQPSVEEHEGGGFTVTVRDGDRVVFRRTQDSQGHLSGGPVSGPAPEVL